MKRYLLLIIYFFLLTTLFGQTIIELKPGGEVRSKTAEDYRKEEPGWTEKQKADSLQYNDHITRALNALYRDSIAQAEVLLNEALKLRPNAVSNYIVRDYLGRIAIAKCDFRQAISVYSTLLKDYPEYRKARFDRASCYLEIKNIKAALEDCQILFNAELSKEEQVKALFLRAACHNENRHPEKAKTDLEKILRIDPKNESALILLALTYDYLGQPSEALNRFNLFVTSHPHSIEGLVARAELEEKQEMYDLARADYDKAISISPEEPSLYIRRAQLLSKMKLSQQAEKDIRKAVDLGYPPQAIAPLMTKVKK